MPLPHKIPAMNWARNKAKYDVDMDGYSINNVLSILKIKNPIQYTEWDTDPGAGINAAIEDAYANGGSVLVPRLDGDQEFSTTIELRQGVPIDFNAVALKYTGSGTALKNKTASDRMLYVRGLSLSTAANRSNASLIAIYLTGSYDADIEIFLVQNFTEGLKLASSSAGCALNRIVLGAFPGTKIAVHLHTSGTGYVNENKFYGGDLNASSPGAGSIGIKLVGIGSSVCQHNVFFSPSIQNFETGISFTEARGNTIFSPRFESNTVDVHYRAQCIANQIIGYSAAIPVVFTDDAGGSNRLFLSIPNIGTWPKGLTISSGSIAITEGFQAVKAESASTDEFDTITGGVIGDTILLTTYDTDENITIQHGTGNILLKDGVDKTMHCAESAFPVLPTIQLFYDGTYWTEVGGHLAPDSIPVNAPAYQFDGSDDQLAHDADEADVDFGTTGDWYIEMVIRPSDVSRTTDYIINKEAGGVGWGLYLNKDDLHLRLDDGTHDVSAMLARAYFTNDIQAHILVSFDRSGYATAYINGIAAMEVNISSVTDTISNAGLMTIGNDCAGANEFAGEIYFTRVGNLTQTASEVLEYSNGGPVPYAYLGASQTELVTGDNNDCDTVGNWTGNGATLTGGYDSGDVGHDKCLRIEADDGANDRAELAQADFTSPTVPGKMYRLKLDYKFINAPTDAAINVGGSIPMELDVGASTWTAYEDTVIVVNNTGPLRIFVCSTGTANNELLIDNITLVRVGCVLQLEQPGIGHNQWIDASGNELHLMVSGALPINLGVQHEEMYVDLALTANSSFTLPMGYKIVSIIVKETAGNALTGGLDVGFAVDAVEVVSGMAVGANATVNCTLVETGTIGATLTTADDTIYLTDGDDDTNWNGAELEVRVQMKRVVMT